MSVSDKASVIEKLIRTHRVPEITYLKANNDKSKRIVTPTFVGEMVYQNKTYLGMRGFCHKAQEDRTFRVDQILETQKSLS